MLTGLIPISGGDASIFGQSILRNLDAVHQIIGVCPQQNVLWDALTVYEHLEIFGRLKGISRKDMKKCIMDMINEVGLTEKVHSPSKTLSGGQKRKLCVAIAFIGDPKVVFLDEPTSGMDVNSRRSTWDIIKRFKKDRVIILTTHFMDEADLLSDRIAIMAKGTVVCCGSSLFLKSVYGVGYSLVVSKNEGEVYSEKIRSLLKKHLEEVEFINDIGGEMLCRIPFSSSFLFPSLFREMDSYSKNFGIKNYGISVTTLEEVFIKVGEGQVAHVSDMKANTDLKRRLSDSKILIDSKRDFEDETKSAQNELLSLMKLSAVSEHKDSIQIFFLHCWALLKKRWHFIKRDKGTLFCLILLPAILMTAGVLGLRALSKFESTNLKMDFSHYQTPVPIPLVQNEYNLIAPILFGSYQNSMIAPLKSSLFGLNESYRGTFAEELFELSNTVKNPMYGAIADISRLDQQYMNVSAVRAIFFCNSTALHCKSFQFSK
jgi:ABC-type multidrug transport system ATPase subunit